MIRSRVARAPYFCLATLLSISLGAILSGVPTQAQSHAAGGDFFSPDRATLFAVPGSVRQVAGKYPATVPLLLTKKSCPADKSGDFFPGSTYSIVAAAPGITVAPNPEALGCQLTTILTLDPAIVSPGYLIIHLVEHRPAVVAGPGVAAAPAKNVDMGDAIITLFDATAGPIPGYPQVDVMWGVQSKNFCADSFGKHVASRVYCIEVKLGNNTGHSLQVAGMGFKPASPLGIGNVPLPDIGPLPNSSYQAVRASAQSADILSSHNLLINGTTALGILMGSFNPFFHSVYNKERFTAGTNVVGTVLPNVLGLLIPDQTIPHLNNLDDASFRDGKLIPNNTQIRTMVFVERKTFQGLGKRFYDSACDALYGPTTKTNKDGNTTTSTHTKALKQCKDTDDDPVAVKIAMGHLVIVGDEIDFIQRIVVDPAVTSQEVTPGAVVAVKSVSTDNLVAQSAGLADGGLKLSALVKTSGTPAADDPYKDGKTVSVDPSSTPNNPVFTFSPALDPKQSYSIQILLPTGQVAATTQKPAAPQ